MTETTPHADAEFFARFGFCRLECDECKRLDAEDRLNGVNNAEALARGFALAMEACNAGDVPPFPEEAR